MTSHDAHAAGADGHHEHHEGEGPHSTFSGYMIGFILSVILTAIPFAVVMTGMLERNTTIVLITAFAVVQILVHMYYFLHLDSKIEAGWTMLSTIFTIVFLGITIAGTLWVMYHMNTNMMPHLHNSAAAERNESLRALDR